MSNDANEACKILRYTSPMMQMRHAMLMKIPMLCERHVGPENPDGHMQTGIDTPCVDWTAHDPPLAHGLGSHGSHQRPANVVSPNLFI